MKACCRLTLVASMTLSGLAVMQASIPVMAQDSAGAPIVGSAQASQPAPQLPPGNNKGNRPPEDPASYTPPPPLASPEVLASGNFSAKANGKQRFHISVAGHTFTSRADIEKYLAYRAALFTEQNKATWFEFVEHRRPGDKLPIAKSDPVLHYSFRLQYFLPTWTYKTAGGKSRTWRPFKGDDFPANELQAAVSYQVSADIVLHSGMVGGTDPHAFAAYPLSDYLLNQTAPPK